MAYPRLLLFLSTVLVWLTLSSCASNPKGVFNNPKSALIPDYSQDEFWAALPWIKDNADKTPEGLIDKQGSAIADVFYLHPTIYYGKRSYNQWNAPIALKSLNEDVDNIAILYQATAFNAAGRIFAPRYRQAHIKAYFNKDTLSAKQAFDLAYTDVKSAFEYYLTHHNNGRPIIIASHSQGTTHAKKLLSEYFDNTSLQNQLVAAYLIGIPVELNAYKTLKPCKNENETGCLIGWRTFKAGADPDFLSHENNILITNPLSWNIDDTKIAAEDNLGSVLTDFEALPIPHLVGAQIHESILWCEKPKFRGSFLMTTDNYHRGDINLYYVNIRENASLRVNQFLNQNSSSN